MAYISVDDARYFVMNQYRNPTWIQKVRNMPDKQVIAIYFSMLETGRFNKPKKKSENTHKPINTNKPIKIELPQNYFKPFVAEQLSLF